MAFDLACRAAVEQAHRAPREDAAIALEIGAPRVVADVDAEHAGQVDCARLQRLKQRLRAFRQIIAKCVAVTCVDRIDPRLDHGDRAGQCQQPLRDAFGGTLRGGSGAVRGVGQRGDFTRDRSRERAARPRSGIRQRGFGLGNDAGQRFAHRPRRNTGDFADAHQCVDQLLRRGQRRSARGSLDAFGIAARLSQLLDDPRDAGVARRDGRGKRIEIGA